jgi:hypothetical protein
LTWTPRITGSKLNAEDIIALQTLPPPIEGLNERTPVIHHIEEGETVDHGCVRTMNSKIIFFVGLLISASGLVSPPVALLAGIAYGFSVVHPLSPCTQIR